MSLASVNHIPDQGAMKRPAATAAASPKRKAAAKTQTKTADLATEEGADLREAAGGAETADGEQKPEEREITETPAEGGELDVAAGSRLVVKQCLGKYRKLAGTEEVVSRLVEILQNGDTLLNVACEWATVLAPMLAAAMHDFDETATKKMAELEADGHAVDDIQECITNAAADGKLTVDVCKLEALTQEKYNDPAWEDHCSYHCGLLLPIHLYWRIFEIKHGGPAGVYTLGLSIGWPFQG